MSSSQSTTTSSSTPTPCEVFLKNLIGSWTGSGSVFGFSLADKVVYYDVDMSAHRPMGGNTVANFVQSHLESRHMEKKIGMHFESGFWRCTSGARGDGNKGDELSWMVAHNSENVEALKGTVSEDGYSARLESQMIGGAAETQETVREISFKPMNGEMRYIFYMRTIGFPVLAPHLLMTFTRKEEHK